jgi:hypothetical protein
MRRHSIQLSRREPGIDKSTCSDVLRYLRKNIQIVQWSQIIEDCDGGLGALRKTGVEQDMDGKADGANATSISFKHWDQLNGTTFAHSGSQLLE